MGKNIRQPAEGDYLCDEKQAFLKVLAFKTVFDYSNVMIDFKKFRYSAR